MACTYWERDREVFSLRILIQSKTNLNSLTNFEFMARKGPKPTLMKSGWNQVHSLFHPSFIVNWLLSSQLLYGLYESLGTLHSIPNPTLNWPRLGRPVFAQSLDRCNGRRLWRDPCLTPSLRVMVLLNFELHIELIYSIKIFYCNSKNIPPRV